MSKPTGCYRCRFLRTMYGLDIAMTNWWGELLSQFSISLEQIRETATLFWLGLVGQFSLIGLVDLILVITVLWWLYRKLRRTELITIFPKVFLLLIFVLLSRIMGLWALCYLSGFLLLIVLLAISALYAPEIKHILTSDLKISQHPRTATPNVSTGDMQTAIKTVVEALAVLSRSKKPALFIIKRDKPLTRLVENGTKMNSPLKPDLLIDFFSTDSALSKGATLVDGNKIIAAGSTLFRANARILFNVTNPMIQRAAKELNAVVILSNRTVGDISVIVGDNTYKKLALGDLAKLLQNILVYHRI
jgi:DNA integrity scanning protein DisA with diadenylate cyclase activity